MFNSFEAALFAKREAASKSDKLRVRAAELEALIDALPARHPDLQRASIWREED